VPDLAELLDLSVSISESYRIGDNVTKVKVLEEIMRSVKMGAWSGHDRGSDSVNMLIRCYI
jgi:hypothetical protein